MTCVAPTETLLVQTVFKLNYFKRQETDGMLIWVEENDGEVSRISYLNPCVDIVIRERERERER